MHRTNARIPENLLVSGYQGTPVLSGSGNDDPVRRVPVEVAGKAARIQNGGNGQGKHTDTGPLGGEGHPVVQRLRERNPPA